MTARPAADQSLYTELAAVIRAEGLLDRRLGYYGACIAITVLAFVGLWAAVVAIGDSWWQLAVAAAMGVVVTQFGFLGHEGTHQQVFRSPTWNAWTARILAGAFAGLSYGWWRAKHNRHHANPNREGSDPDIAAGALAFTVANAEARTSRAGRWLIAHQGWLFFPMLTLEDLNLHLSSVRTLVTDRSVPHRRTELALVCLRLGGYVAALLVLLPPGKAAAFFGVQMAVFGLCLGGSFAPNHKGMPIVHPASQIDFLRRQVLMSRNVRGGRVLDVMMGGLNHQVEHHLFPSMPRPNLRRAGPLVRARCERHGVPYVEVGLLTSYAIVVDYLNHVGLRARGPFECPLASTFREGGG